MKLLSINLARSIWLFPLKDLNPYGQYDVPIFKNLCERYKFTSYPEAMDLMKTQQEGIKCQIGSFQKLSGEFVSVDLTIYNDGLVADTRSSTADSDAFLEDVLNWLTEEYNFTSYKNILRSIVYVSELYVSSKKTLNAFNPKIRQFENRLSSRVPGYGKISMELSSISFWTDPGKIGRATAFVLERAEGIPFKENRYYSAAPLRTETHLEMLNELEELLSD